MHAPQVQRRVGDVGALPERVAIRQHHVAGRHQRRPLQELVVGIDAAHPHVLGKSPPHAPDVAQQFLLGQFVAQQHLVADHGDVHQPLLGQRQRLDLALVAFPVVADPGTDHRLESLGARHRGDQPVPVGAGEGTDPARVGCDDVDAAADLRLRQHVARPLALGIGAEAQSVDAAREHLGNSHGISSAVRRAGASRPRPTGSGRARSTACARRPDSDDPRARAPCAVRARRGPRSRGPRRGRSRA